MKPIFCFIDDSAFELDVFRENIVPAGTGLKFILGSTYRQVRAEIGDDYPALFVLDLYGRDPALSAGGIPPPEKLNEQIKQFPSLDAIYSGLDDFTGDRVNEYLKRMFHLTDAWRRLFAQTFKSTGQSIKYGLGNYAAATTDFPAASAVAYTRKSIISDAEEALAAGLNGLNLKPDAGSDAEIRRVTAVRAPELIKGWSKLVTQRYRYYLQSQALTLIRAGLARDIANLSKPSELSNEARDSLTPASIKALEAISAWQNYAGIELLD